MDTIFALSSGIGTAGVAVVRLSGKNVRFGLETIIGEVPQPRIATLRRLKNDDGTDIDKALVLYFPAPHSFTGEDCAEFHVHGGRAVINATLERLSGLDGYRHAEAGEFTRRAFDNNKMDLTAVEGLADLIAADTEIQRRVAFSQASGQLFRLYERWRQQLIRARALIEADFDFSDEEDVPGSVAQSIWPDLHKLSVEIAEHLDAARSGEIIRNGLRVVILGKPNSGKSSLLNHLAKRDVAIVSEEAGTTRDLLEVHLDIDGYPITICDTAGLRSDVGSVEAEGIRRALAAARDADLLIYLEDLTQHQTQANGPAVDTATIRVGSKADLLRGKVPHGLDCTISITDSDGTDPLLTLLKNEVMSASALLNEAVPTRQRHRDYIKFCKQFVDEAVQGESLPLELRSESLRSASEWLGRLTGRIDVDDLLDLIFGEFCIGK